MAKSAAAATDPVPGLIDAFRKANAADLAAIAETDMEDTEEECHAANDAFWALIETNPTTLAGEPSPG